MDTPAIKPLQGTQAKHLRGFNEDFCAKLPGDARFGRYDAEPGDRFAKVRVPVPNGRYRVVGSEWIHEFVGGRFVRAVRATAENEFGGADVVGVESEPAAKGA